MRKTLRKHEYTVIIFFYSLTPFSRHTHNNNDDDANCVGAFESGEEGRWRGKWLGAHAFQWKHVFKDADHGHSFAVVVGDVEVPHSRLFTADTQRRPGNSLAKELLESRESVRHLVVGRTRSFAVVGLVAVRSDDPLVPVDVTEADGEGKATAALLAVAPQTVAPLR